MLHAMVRPLRASGTAPRRLYRARTLELASGGSLAMRPDGRDTHKGGLPGA